MRTTHDIDVNGFLPAAEAERVFAVLGELGAAVENPGLRKLVAQVPGDRDVGVQRRQLGAPLGRAASVLEDPFLRGAAA